MKLRDIIPCEYDTEITNDISNIENGTLVDVLSQSGTYLGTGLMSQNSKIRVRILSNNANETFSDAFWERRIRYAIEYKLESSRRPTMHLLVESLDYCSCE